MANPLRSILFILTLLTNPSAFARADLAMPLRSLGLHSSITEMLAVDEPGELDVRRLVRMDWWTLERRKSMTRSMFKELRTFVADLGLDFHLNETEIEAYETFGVTPAVSKNSFVDRLNLGFRARDALRALNIRFVADLAAVTRADFARAKAPGRVIDEIQRAVAPFGIVIWASELERRLTTEGRLDETLVRLDRVGLPALTVLRLHQADIWNVRELRARDQKTDLRLLPGLGPQARVAVERVLRRYGHEVAWKHRVSRMDLPKAVKKVIAARFSGAVKTRDDLRRMMESGQFASRVDFDEGVIVAVHRALDDPDCGARLSTAVAVAR